MRKHLDYKPYPMDCGHGFYFAPADHFEHDPFGPQHQRCKECAERHATWRAEDSANNFLEIETRVHHATDLLAWVNATYTSQYSYGASVTMGPYDHPIGFVVSSQVHRSDTELNYAEITVKDLRGELWKGLVPANMFSTDPGGKVRISVHLRRENKLPAPTLSVKARVKAVESKE